MAPINRLHLCLLFLSFPLLSTATPVSDSQYLEVELLCKQTYGFMPCSTTALGNLFLIIVYGYLIFVGSKYVFDGSELLKILGPGRLGKAVLPQLAALPSAILILVSGLSGTKESAQSRVSVGMGLLAGSTVMLLTVIWGSCVIVGKCDIEHSVAKDGQNTKGFSLTETGVSTDSWTCYTARIMAISVIPFIVVQIPQILHSTSGRNLAVLIALIVSVLMFIAYCLYQVFWPWIQSWSIAYARLRRVTSIIAKHLRQHAAERLLNDGEPNKIVLKKLFGLIDDNKDGQLSVSEVKALIMGINFEGIKLCQDDLDKLLIGTATNRDNQIDSDGFIECTEKWLNAVHQGNRGHDPGFQNEFCEKTQRELDFLGVEEETFEAVANRRLTRLKAASMLFIGTITAFAFAHPLVDAITNFSNATNVPPFFVSFIALPMATKFSVVVQLLIHASRKTRQTASSTFIELYTTVSTDNVIYLSVFLAISPTAIVYIRGLSWDFSAEVLAIAVVCILVGGFASFRTTFPLWTCLLACMLYPFSLALVYVLDCVLGWA
ncbi:sodium/calcium exchanger NCL-like [Mangifera indica]|uniref:sodium/calcium exchanger NCL-like n=1 Tax=Mangifera indica TaxID=29780 RepID=UPI001CFAE369|nr:sodium/calcium exchanger NCL-like [Mangifera indica]